MKKIKLLTLAITCLLCGCNDFLDQAPMSAISPEVYFTDESQLASFVNGLYDILPSGMVVHTDQYTDNHAAASYSVAYVPGEWKLGQSGGDWDFSGILNCNLFFKNVLPKYEAGAISGSNVKQYIGEVYLLRAYVYFGKLRALGDFPIVTEQLPSEMEPLIEASKRAPRNEVARFILSDLDKAIELLSTNFGGRKTRINKESALLLKSRVALYEGTWLKYFKGTAFVPGGPEWPGASKDYNRDFQYPSGSIDNEINFFLDQAIDAAEKVASTITLTNNTGLVQQDASEAANPYMDMFANLDLSGYNEVLMWREYNRSLGLSHSMMQWGSRSNDRNGLTKSLVDSYLMANGLPIYASGSGYHGDDYISDIRKDRDNRLFLFLKEPGQINYWGGTSTYTRQEHSPINIDGRYGTSTEFYNTGYTTRKGNPTNPIHGTTGTSGDSYTGIIVFHGVEALLNYIEAWYERNGSLNGTAMQYWRAIRVRAKVDTDVNKTIAATDMTKEANDWGAWSAGQLVDATLYNIRRERRCELFVEGLRSMDLKRWRSYDQMINTPYHVEGIKVWGPLQEQYKDDSGNSTLVYGLTNPAAVVSPPDRSIYLRPFEKSQASLVLNGYRWAMAHYLNPISLQHFLITSQENDPATSPIYQNPGWTLTVGEGATF
jgi:hypothetical protein